MAMVFYKTYTFFIIFTILLSMSYSFVIKTSKWFKQLAHINCVAMNIPQCCVTVWYGHDRFKSTVNTELDIVDVQINYSIIQCFYI